MGAVGWVLFEIIFVGLSLLLIFLFFGVLWGLEERGWHLPHPLEWMSALSEWIAGKVAGR